MIRTLMHGLKAFALATLLAASAPLHGASTSSDVIDGVSTSTAMKAPVRSVTTTNITLSGLSAISTIDGTLTPADGDRFLLTGQTTTSQNLIYVARATAWEVAKDADGARDLRDGTLVKTQGSVFYALTTSDPVVPGTTSLTWVRLDTLASTGSVAHVATITALKALTGLTDGQIVEVSCYYTCTTPDGGGGRFRYNASSSASDDGGVTIDPDAVGDGRWIRIHIGTLALEAFGAKGDNSTNDYASIQALIDYLNGQGGGVAEGQRGRTYKLNTGPIIKDKVVVRLNGAKLRLTLTGTGGYDYGVRIRSNAGIEGGEIAVESSGSVGTQAGIHAAMHIGPMYGDGGTVASPSAEEGVHNWYVRNMKLSTNRDGKVAMQIVGGANNGIVENIEVPDSAVMFGAVHLDWGYLGTISTADIPGSRTRFDAGTAYMTHPNNIAIRNIKIGSLTRAKSGVDTGAHGIRLSSVYNILVENVTIKKCTYAALRHTAGDLGAEFTPAAEKPMVHQNIIFRNVNARDTTDGWLIYHDSYADNINDEPAYTELLDPLYETNIIFENVNGVGSGGASVENGLLVLQARGGTFRNIEAKGYLNGALVDEKVHKVLIEGGRFYSNRGNGVKVHHGTTPPEDVTVRGVKAYLNGTDAAVTANGVYVQTATRTQVEENHFGAEFGTETTQFRGVLIDTAALNTRIVNNHVHAVKAGGVGYNLAAGGSYGAVDLFTGNTVAVGITGSGGQEIVPISYTLDPATGGVRRIWRANKSSLSGDTTPTAGAWVAGDIIEFTNPAAGGKIGSVCVTSGSPGTWKLFGAIDA